MTDWKDQAHLFAGGKFKVRVDYGAEIVSWTLIPDILAQINSNNLMGQCTLIARPISDLSYEEKDDIWQTTDPTDTWEDHRMKLEEHYNMTAPRDVDFEVSMQDEADELEDIILNFTPATLLSLEFGVYPFNQNHFATGEVIDATQVK